MQFNPSTQDVSFENTCVVCEICAYTAGTEPEPRECTRHDPEGPSSQTILDLKSLPSHKKVLPRCWKMALPMPSEPLRQKPLPVLAARLLDVVSMEIDVRSAKNRASV